MILNRCQVWSQLMVIHVDETRACQSMISVLYFAINAAVAMSTYVSCFYSLNTGVSNIESNIERERVLVEQTTKR